MEIRYQTDVSTAATTTFSKYATKMPPAPRAVTMESMDDGAGEVGAPLLELASTELEQMRMSKNGGCFHSFPPACLALLKEIKGNHRCVDCGDHNPQWAACRYGAMLCLQCSGHHRSLGVQVSCVRSISMDEWSLTEVVSMLEGGNGQIDSFFDRHRLTSTTIGDTSALTKENVNRQRYKTKAALFYRRQMELHVANVLNAGPYRGREISRRLHTLETRNSSVA